jgi:Sas10/Utp3/C1D family
MLKTFDVSSVEGGENMKESLETYYHVLMKYVANFLSIHQNCNQCICSYNVNLSFYLLLKTRRASVKNHPVARRLLQYRILLRKIHKKWILPKNNNLIQNILTLSEEQLRKGAVLQTVSNQYVCRLFPMQFFLTYVFLGTNCLSKSCLLCLTTRRQRAVTKVKRVS